MKLKSSSQGPSLVLAGLSLLCAGWLLGYGLAGSSKMFAAPAMRNAPFGKRSMTVPTLNRELPSWRSVPTTTKIDSEP